MNNNIPTEQDITNLQINNGSPSDVKEEKKIRTRKVTPTTHPLPHSGSNFEQHLKIIRAYFIATNEGKKAVMYKDFEHSGLDFHHTYISANNKFLQDLGLIEQSGSYGMYVPTKNALEYQRHIDWGQKEKALAILKELVKNSWFWESVKQVLLIQENGTEENDLLNKLGADSNANRDKHMGSLKILISYLENVGLVKRDEKTNKIKMALGLMPEETSPTNPVNEEKGIGTQIIETNQKPFVASQPALTAQNTPPKEPDHYREEPGRFTLRVKLDEISIQLLEEEIKFIKSKYALLQKMKKVDEETKTIS